MNQNGLLSHKDITSRGDINSNYYRRVRDGVPIEPAFNRVKTFGNIDTNSTTPVIVSSYNVASITRNGVGQYTINLQTPFSFAQYAVVLTIEGNQNGKGTIPTYTILTSSSFRVLITNSVATFLDPNGFTFAVYGFQPGSIPPNQFDGVIANNGLLGSTDLASTGEVASVYFIRKIQLLPPLPTAGLVKAYSAILSTGSNPLIRTSSFNIASITTLNNGIYRVFLTNAMPNNKYAVIVTTGGSTTGTQGSSIICRYGRETAGNFLLTFTRSDVPATAVLPGTFSFVVFSL